MLEYQCPHCKEILSIPEQFIGATGTCRKCKSSITIEAKPENGKQSDSGLDATSRPPVLVAFHIETTGPASRKHSILEVAAVKVDTGGKVLDTFWSFCNPDDSIPEGIVDRTGIADDMVAASPFPFEVVKEFFDWLGPRAIILTDHAHYHAKFLNAALLKEDILPPDGRILDVVHWAEDLEMPAPEYKLRPMLEAIGQPLRPLHRALDEANGVAYLLPHIFQRQVAKLPRQEDTRKMGRLLGKKQASESDARLFKVIDSLAVSLDKMCGSSFHEREKFEERKRLRAQASANGTEAKKASVRLHLPEWYEERKRLLSVCQQNGSDEQDPKLNAEDTGWTQALMEASTAPTSDEQRQHLLQAITLGARDPWPYERLTGFYIRSKDYKSAQKVCEQYFESDNWRVPQYADSSLKLLTKMQKLERRLAEAS